MPKYSDIVQQIEKLQRKADEARKKEMQDVIADIRSKMKQYGITAKDLSGPAPRAGKSVVARKGPRKGVKVPAKYIDKATGNSWTGRGIAPRWLQDAEAAGRKREEFLVAQPAAAASAA